MLASGCAQTSGTTTSSSNFSQSTTLTVSTDGAWSTFDPTNTSNLPSIQIIEALYDRLLYIGADGKLLPWLASSWQQTPTRLTFTLKKGVTCSDGTPLTASDVAMSYDRFLGISNPKTKGALAPAEFGPGPFTVSADDSAGTFTLTLGTPWGEALNDVAGADGGADTLIVCPKGLVAGALSDAAYGTGAYKIASEDRASSITLKLRPEWSWGPGGRTAKGLPGTLVYKIVSNETTAANLLLTGGLDVARIQGQDVQRLLANDSLGHHKVSANYTNPMWMNSAPGHATADVAVREALSTAVSADGWNIAAYGGLGTPTTSLLATNAPCFEPATAQYVPKTDVSKAKGVLLADGYTSDSSGKLTKGGQPLTINLVGDVLQGAGPEYFDSQFTQLGITVNFITTDHVTYSSSYLAPGKWDVIVPGLSSNSAGLTMQFFSGPTPPAGRNWSRIQDPAIDALILKAEEEVGARSCADWKAVQIAWLQKYYFRPLASQNFYWFSRNPKWTFTASTNVLEPTSLE